MSTRKAAEGYSLADSRSESVQRTQGGVSKRRPLWPRKGRRHGKGYGVFQVGGKKRRAHRWLVERALGYELDPDIFVCHTCDNPPCCNPRHFFVGDALDNNQYTGSLARAA